MFKFNVCLCCKQSGKMSVASKLNIKSYLFFFKLALLYMHSVQVDIKLKHKLYLCKIQNSYQNRFWIKKDQFAFSLFLKWLTDVRSNSHGFIIIIIIIIFKATVKCYRTVTVQIIKQMRDSWHLFQNGLSAVVFCHYAKWWGPHCDLEVEENPLKLNIFCVSPCRHDFWVSWLQLLYW